MRHRRLSTSLALTVATTLVAAAPVALAALGPGPQIRVAGVAAAHGVPAQFDSAPLAGVPDVNVPLRRLSGLNLPDLRLPSLKKFVPAPPLTFLGTHPIAAAGTAGGAWLYPLT